MQINTSRIRYVLEWAVGEERKAVRRGNMCDNLGGSGGNHHNNTVHNIINKKPLIPSTKTNPKLES